MRYKDQLHWEILSIKDSTIQFVDPVSENTVAQHIRDRLTMNQNILRQDISKKAQAPDILCVMPVVKTAI